MLKRGFHVCYIYREPDDKWDAWHTFVTERHGLAKKPAFIGMSRGGANAYRWATANPDKVSCIYADNPGIGRDNLMQLDGLAANDVPLLNVCGSIDPLLEYTLKIESVYRALGGRISVILQEGLGHHPHSLRDPKPIVDFIVNSAGLADSAAHEAPDYVGENFTREWLYGGANSYRFVPSEKTFLTCRGPWFEESYRRYRFQLSGKWKKPLRVTVIAPQTIASGKPWVFRSDHVTRDSKIDLALLAQGYHLVTGPVPINADGPVLEEWNAVHRHLVSHGFSTKPVLAGAGGAALKAYAWAVVNPDKVACVYAENPVMRSNLTEFQPIDNLAPLAKAGVPLFHSCGGLDPLLNDHTRVTEKRYRDHGGRTGCRSSMVAATIQKKGPFDRNSHGMGISAKISELSAPSKEGFLAPELAPIDTYPHIAKFMMAHYQYPPRKGHYPTVPHS